MALVIDQLEVETGRGITHDRGNRLMDASEAEYSWFFREEFPGVVRTAYLVLHDRSAAEDVAQEAFTQLLLNWSKVATYEAPAAWVRRVAIRLAVRIARREQLRTTLLGWLDAPRSEPSTDLDLAVAVKSLPPRQRAVVALFYYDDKPLTEIAQLLGCSHSTAKVHLFKARQRLAVLLGADHRGDDHVS